MLRALGFAGGLAAGIVCYRVYRRWSKSEAGLLPEHASRSTTVKLIGPEMKIPLYTGPPRNKWYGGVLAGNGKVYAIPGNADRVLEVDPETKDVWPIGDNLMRYGRQEEQYSPKWVGGVRADDGKIYATVRRPPRAAD